MEPGSGTAEVDPNSPSSPAASSPAVKHKGVRVAPAGAVTERQRPEVTLVEEIPRVEHERADKDPGVRVVGVDPAVAAVIPDEQVATELA
jgi:hypothetical protein